MTKKYQHTKVVPLFGGRVFLLESKTDGIIGPLLAHEADAELDRLHPTHAPYSICRDDKDGSNAFNIVVSFEEQPEPADRIASAVAWGRNRATEPRAASVSYEHRNAAYESGTEAEQPEKPLRDNLACAEVKLDKIDELTAQVHAHLEAERAYLVGETGYYR